MYCYICALANFRRDYCCQMMIGPTPSFWQHFVVLWLLCCCNRPHHLCSRSHCTCDISFFPSIYLFLCGWTGVTVKLCESIQRTRRETLEAATCIGSDYRRALLAALRSIINCAPVTVHLAATYRTACGNKFRTAKVESEVEQGGSITSQLSALCHSSSQQKSV
jgi:hypothetical protein